MKQKLSVGTAELRVVLFIGYPHHPKHVAKCNRTNWLGTKGGLYEKRILFEYSQRKEKIYMKVDNT